MPTNMPIIADPPAQTAVTPLDWDSVHFGFPVGRIAGQVSDADLHAALAGARSEQFRLIYWATAPERSAPPWLLAEFDGRLVDRKVTYARLLRQSAPATRPTGGEAAITIVPFGRREVSAELTALAIAAGAYSRFAIDPRIPRDRFEELYRLWIARSVCGEMAGTVLVAVDVSTDGGVRPDIPGDLPAATALAGVITIKVTSGVGNIGLIAVAESHRGRGIGSRLIDAAHDWMIERGAAKATVVTQTANAPACALYRRAGYTIEHAENYYHFWP